MARDEGTAVTTDELGSNVGVALARIHFSRAYVSFGPLRTLRRKGLGPGSAQHPTSHIPRPHLSEGGPSTFGTL
jgi:hypothetical protein